MNANSNMIQTIDALNRISTNVMDALDRVQATITPNGYITTINRDGDGRAISVLNASGFLSSTVFDNASNQIASISPLGIIQTIIRDVNNQVIGNQNGLGLIYTTVLDAAGRPIATINPLSYRSSVAWDGASQRVASIDSLGTYATSVWAANGQLIASQNELGALTSFVLDAASQRICVVDANNGRSTVGWDVRGLRSYEQDQLGALTSFSHDPNQNTILRVDARNWPTSYTVDALNRTAQTQYIDGTRVTNSWDAAGQQIVSADSTGITSNVWDLDSRKTGTVYPTGIALTNTLDPLGNRLVMADPYGRTTYSWDNQSRLASIQNPLNERTSLTWDALDREQHRVLGNGGAISHTWDNAGRETLIENRDKNGVGQAIFTNTYSPVDTRLTVLELDRTRATFSYDASRQIISEARGGTMAYARSYTWDPNGNRIQQYDSGVLTSGTFNAANQQTLISPASGPPTTQLYDANGNLSLATTGSAVTTQTWSPDNKIVGVVSPTESETYLCSADGLRKSQTTATGTVLFTYDEVLVLLETDTSGNLQARNTDYPGEFGGLASQNRSGVTSYYGIDSNLSTRILVSVGGVITDSYSYKAFGDPLQTGSGTVNPHTFVGLERYRRQTNGFYLLGVRILDPFTGRFNSVDPIGFVAGDWNLFRYVGNEPTTMDDPTGYIRNCTCVTGNCSPPCVGIGNDDGYTNCDGDTGNMYSCNCPPNYDSGMLSGWNKCVTPCANVHEAQHRADGAACCSGYAACRRTANKNAILLARCNSAWTDWWGSENDPDNPPPPAKRKSECYAYMAGIACLDGAISRYCQQTGMGQLQTQICNALRAELDDMRRQRDKYCFSLPAKVPGCPFDANGRLNKGKLAPR